MAKNSGQNTSIMLLMLVVLVQLLAASLGGGGVQGLKVYKIELEDDPTVADYELLENDWDDEEGFLFDEQKLGSAMVVVEDSTVNDGWTFQEPNTTSSAPGWVEDSMHAFTSFIIELDDEELEEEFSPPEFGIVGSSPSADDPTFFLG